MCSSDLWRLESEQQREEEQAAEALPEPDTEAPAEALPDQEPVIHTYNVSSGGEAAIADFDLAKDQLAFEVEGFVNDAGLPRFEDLGIEDTAEGVQFDFGNGNTLTLEGRTLPDIEADGLMLIDAATGVPLGDAPPESYGLEAWGEAEAPADRKSVV